MSRTITSQLIVSLLDRVSGPAGKAGAALMALQKKARASITAPIMRDFRRAGGAMTEFRNAMYGPAGIAAALAGHQMFAAQVSYETSMNRIKATSHASAVELGHLRDLINDLAIRYPKKRAEIAEGALQLFKSGKDVHEVMGALEPTLTAALASEQTIGHSGETLTDIVFGMGLRASTAKEAMETFTQVADTAVTAANAFNMNYEQFVQGMAKAAPIGRITGMSLRDVATTIGVLADEGFKGERGGTAFATSMVRLGAQTKKARKELAAARLDLSKFTHATRNIKKLGGKTLADVLSEDIGVDASALIPSFDRILRDPKLNSSATVLGRELQKAIASGLGMDANSPNIEKVRDAVDTFLRASMSKMDVPGIFRYLAEHNADANIPLMNELFGKHHLPKMVALINAFRQELWDKRNKYIAEHESGAAQAYANTLQEGLPGALHRLASAWDHMGEVLFVQTGLIDHFVTAFEKLRGALSALRGADPALLKALGYGLTGLLSAGAAAIAFDVLKIAASGLRLAFVALTSPIAWVIAGLAALAYFNWDAIKSGWSDFSSGFGEAFWGKLKPDPGIGKAWHNLAAEFKDLSGVNIDISSWRELGQILGGAVAKAVNILAGGIKSLISGLASALRYFNEFRSAMSGVGEMRDTGISRGLPKGFSVPGKAAGGPVIGGHPYVVGEVGPELFVPRTSGSIVPNHKLAGGGSITLSPVLNFHGVGHMGPAELARYVRTELRRIINEDLRGVQADFGLRWT